MLNYPCRLRLSLFVTIMMWYWLVKGFEILILICCCVNRLTTTATTTKTPTCNGSKGHQAQRFFHTWLLFWFWGVIKLNAFSTLVKLIFWGCWIILQLSSFSWSYFGLQLECWIFIEVICIGILLCLVMHAILEKPAFCIIKFWKIQIFAPIFFLDHIYQQDRLKNWSN